MTGNDFRKTRLYGNHDNKAEWIVDEEDAKTVRRIFALCIEGFGPTQIAKKLKSEKVLTPTESDSSHDGIFHVSNLYPMP